MAEMIPAAIRAQAHSPHSLSASQALLASRQHPRRTPMPTCLHHSKRAASNLATMRTLALIPHMSVFMARPSTLVLRDITGPSKTLICCSICSKGDTGQHAEEVDDLGRTVLCFYVQSWHYPCNPGTAPAYLQSCAALQCLHGMPMPHCCSTFLIAATALPTLAPLCLIMLS